MSELAPTKFEQELEILLNRNSMENGSDTPDFILAKYLSDCLDNYSRAVKARDKWFNVEMWSTKVTELKK